MLMCLIQVTKTLEWKKWRFIEFFLCWIFFDSLNEGVHPIWATWSRIVRYGGGVGLIRKTVSSRLKSIAIVPSGGIILKHVFGYCPAGFCERKYNRSRENVEWLRIDFKISNLLEFLMISDMETIAIVQSCEHKNCCSVFLKRRRRNSIQKSCEVPLVNEGEVVKLWLESIEDMMIFEFEFVYLWATKWNRIQRDMFQFFVLSENTVVSIEKSW